jgi:hypothetical protein
VSTARHADETAEAMAVASALGRLDEDPARLLYAPENTRYGSGRSRGREHSRSFPQVDDAALLDRLRTLRSILPALATEVAIARREGARLRRENARLRAVLDSFEGGLRAGMGVATATHAAAQGGAR